MPFLPSTNEQRDDDRRITRRLRTSGEAWVAADEFPDPHSMDFARDVERQHDECGCEELRRMIAEGLATYGLAFAREVYEEAAAQHKEGVLAVLVEAFTQAVTEPSVVKPSDVMELKSFLLRYEEDCPVAAVMLRVLRRSDN
jgi:hypothetical protein